MAEIVRLERVDIVDDPWVWPFARDQRGAIDRHFAQRTRERPGIWNGRVLLLCDGLVTAGVLRGRCFETDYASFLAWRDWNCPDRSVSNFFAAGALRGADDAYLLGEMAPHTAAAGHIYFPCGTPEPGDLVDGRVDLDASIARELREETGLDAGDFEVEPGWTLVTDGCYRAFIRRLNAAAPAEDLRRRAQRHLAAELGPELAAIHVVRGPADLDRRMPAYVAAFLIDAWRARR